MQTMKKPSWLKVRLGAADDYRHVEVVLKRHNLNTVCQAAACPNQCECFSRKTATFLLMGSICTRYCRFCNVETGKPLALDRTEPLRVAAACTELGLKHCVLTSVTRDDLQDGGAGHIAATIRAVKKTALGVTVEVLVPDFGGRMSALKMIMDAGPHIMNHNIETIERLYPEVRPQAKYRRSIELLGRAKKLTPEIYTKSGVMLGLGETLKEIDGAFKDLRKAGCDLLTIGQYLAPSRAHFPVKAYIHKDVFRQIETKALELGFLSVSAGPLVRSSYNAEGFFKSIVHVS